MAGDRKLFLGGRLRRLRRELGLNQSAMAAELGLSPSYLNHLERNQRPVTAQVLLRLAQAYDVDLKSLTAEGEGTGMEQLAEIFAHPMFADIGIPRYELLEVADNAPSVADAISRLYTALIDRRQAPEGAEAGEEKRLVTPETWVRDHIQGQRNSFPYLEEAAETLAGALGEPVLLFAALRTRLKEGFGVDTRVVPPETLEATSQHYDYHRKRLMLSSLLRPESRTFAIAYQVALFEFRPLLARLLDAAAPPDMPTRRLLHMSLANYAAGAIMMPYAPFLAAAEAQRYDIDRLCAEFGASVEQVAHRLTTLNRSGSGARGIPFFMLRVDAAGNISKRFAGESFPFSRFGGTCPRWNLHGAFRTPERVITQIVETPDGQRFFTLSRTVDRAVRLDPRENSQLAIGLGCDVKHAPRIVYSDGLDLADPYVTPIGPACAICPRLRCPQRAAAPAGRTLTVNEMQKTISPYPFLGG